MMKRILTALTVVASLIASGASAFDPEDVQKLTNTNECVECDLSKANLPPVTLLLGANLTGANLTDANLTGANLTSALLQYATMNDAILCNTTMPDGSVIYSGC